MKSTHTHIYLTVAIPIRSPHFVSSLNIPPHCSHPALLLQIFSQLQVRPICQQNRQPPAPLNALSTLVARSQYKAEYAEKFYWHRWIVTDGKTHDGEVPKAPKIGKNIYIWTIFECRNRPGVAQRVPGGLGSQFSMTFGTWRWWGQPHAPAAFTHKKYSWYSFSLGAESTPGPWCGRKEYVNEKSSDTTGNRCRDRPTSSAGPVCMKIAEN